MEARPTLDAVAALAGVSTATVSRVLNDSARVSEATRAAVEAAVAQLRHVPNPAARNLARRRTDAIALVISEAEQRLFGDPFFGACNRDGNAGGTDSAWGNTVDPAAGAWFRAQALQLAQLASPPLLP